MLYDFDVQKTDNSICRHCFQFNSIDNGRRMIIERCGGDECDPIVNSTVPLEVLPTIDYDEKECGQVKITSPMEIISKSLALKVSTGVKNILRPAEYPWLVSSHLMINQ